MGIHSRDYIRETPPPAFGRPAGLWAVRYLLIANIVVFVLQVVTGEPGRFGNLTGGITQWLSLNRTDLFPTFQIWRLVTYGFCHDTRSLQHIAINLFVLWMFGRNVEPIYGSREFLAFYLTGVVLSGLCHVGMQVVMHDPAGVIGASGGVMAVVFLTAMLFPREKVYVMFILPLELRWMAVLYAAADVMGIVSGGSNVAHAAHLAGAAFGVLYKYNNWRIMPLFARWPRLKKRAFSGRQSKVHLYRPPRETPSREDVSARVDALLEKISRDGEASLTDDERRFLKDASRRYRDH